MTPEKSFGLYLIIRIFFWKKEIFLTVQGGLTSGKELYC